MGRFWAQSNTTTSSPDMRSRFVKQTDQVFTVSLRKKKAASSNNNRRNRSRGSIKWVDEGGSEADSSSSFSSSSSSSSASLGFEVLQSIGKNPPKTQSKKKKPPKSRRTVDPNADPSGFQLVPHASGSSLEQYASTESRERQNHAAQMRLRGSAASSDDSSGARQPGKRGAGTGRKKRSYSSSDSNSAMEQLMAVSMGIQKQIQEEIYHESRTTETTKPSSGSCGSENNIIYGQDLGPRNHAKRTFSQRNLMESSNSSDSSITISISSNHEQQRGTHILPGDMMARNGSDDEMPNLPARALETPPNADSAAMNADGLFSSDEEEEKEALSSPYLQKRSFYSGNIDHGHESMESFVVLEDEDDFFQDEYNETSKDSSMHFSNISQFQDEYVSSSSQGNSLHHSNTSSESLSRLVVDELETSGTSTQKNRSVALAMKHRKGSKNKKRGGKKMTPKSILKNNKDMRVVAEPLPLYAVRVYDNVPSSETAASRVDRDSEISSNRNQATFAKPIYAPPGSDPTNIMGSSPSESKMYLTSPPRNPSTPPRELLLQSPSSPRKAVWLDVNIKPYPSSPPGHHSKGNLSYTLPAPNQNKAYPTSPPPVYSKPNTSSSSPIHTNKQHPFSSQPNYAKMQASSSPSNHRRPYPPASPTKHAHVYPQSHDNEQIDTEMGYPPSKLEAQPLTKDPSSKKRCCCSATCLVVALINIMLFTLVLGLGVVLFYIYIYEGEGGKVLIMPRNTLSPTIAPTTPLPTLSPQPSVSPAPSTSWRLWEDEDLRGSFSGENLGSTIALSSDGNSLAVVSSNSSKREVQIYMRASIDTDWELKGQPIQSLGSEDDFGFHVALDEKGNRVVIGAPKEKDGLGEIYTFDFVDDWQLTATLTGEASLLDSSSQEMAGTELGNVFDVSSNGEMLVIGEPSFQEKTGRVRLFRFQSNQWNELDFSTSRFGFGVGDEVGSSVSLAVLAPNTFRIAIGSVGSDNASPDSGRVTIFDYKPQSVDSDVSTTSLVGQNTPIRGLIGSQGFGHKVVLSQDGKSLVASSQIGNVRVFRHDQQIDFWLDVLDTTEYDSSEFSIVSTPTGFSAAVVYSACPETGSCDLGPLTFLRVLDFENNRFVTRAGSDLVGLPAGNGSFSLALSNDANVVAVGLPGATTGSLGNAGLVQVYQYRGS